MYNHLREFTLFIIIMNIHEPLLTLKAKDYTFVKVIGTGHYSQVYQVFDQKTKQSYAAKVIPKILFNKIYKFQALVKAEINILMKCRNQNVVSFKQNIATSKSIIIIMELCQGGLLSDYLFKKGRLSENEATCFLKQILNGFKGLHEMKAIHRDINASNIMLHKNTCKIIDLGYSKILQENHLTKTIFGFSPAMAPEMLQQKQYDNRADIWSIAVLYYQLNYAEYPYKGQNHSDLIHHIKTSKINFQKVNISQKAKDFLDKCLKYDVRERMTWRQIYEHPLISQDDQILYRVLDHNLKSKIRQNKMYYSSVIGSNKQKARVKGIQLSPETKKKKYLKQVKQEAQPQNDYKINILSLQQTKQNCPEEIEQPQKIQYTVSKSSLNIKKLEQLNKRRQKTQQMTAVFETQYLNHRNRIMFIFKYITPYITVVYDKLLNQVQHETIAFILCKNASDKMKQLGKSYKQKENMMQLDSIFWSEFIESEKYCQLGQVIQADITHIDLQLQEYESKLLKSEVDNQWKDEADLSAIRQTRWNEYLEHTIQAYQLDLIKFLQSISDTLKKKVILLIKGFECYAKYRQKGQMEQVYLMMQNVEYEKEEILLYQRLFVNM